jgi:TonB family protein
MRHRISRPARAAAGGVPVRLGLRQFGPQDPADAAGHHDLRATDGQEHLDRRLAHRQPRTASASPRAPPTPPTPPPDSPKPVKAPDPAPEPPKARDTAKTKTTPEKSDFAPKKDNKNTPDKKELASENSNKSSRHISTNVVKRTHNNQFAAAQQRANADRARQDAQAEANRRHQALVGQIGGIVNGVGKTLGKSTVVEPLGDGGAAFANWGSLVGEIYKRAVYASHPQSDEDAVAVIRVVVRRDGTVKDADWKSRTGNPALDKAVDRAMRVVREVPPFPADSKDTERGFNINIGFEAKRVTT